MSPGAIAGALATAAIAAGLAAHVGSAAEAGPPRPGQRGRQGADRLGLDQPIYTAAAPGVDGLIYVVLRGGVVLAVDPSDGSSEEFLDVPDVSTAGEGGLLSIAFDPDYQSNGLLYAYYTTNVSHTIRIDEFTALSDTEADPASQRRVMTIPHPGQWNHQGGTIAFGPGDRLYAAPGDGGGSGDPNENAQDRSELTGKVLRIDPHGADPGDYEVPPSNPFVGKPGRDEVYALGLRNPFRFSFDPQNGRIAIGDVGQGSWEEVDIETKESLRKANFGWDHFEGNSVFDWPGDNEAPRPRRHYERPVHTYRHGSAHVITGGVVVRDPNLPSELGRYLYADFGAGRLRSLKPHLGGAKGDRGLGIGVQSPASFGHGPDGAIYITSLTTGKLFRLVSGS